MESQAYLSDFFCFVKISYLINRSLGKDFYSIVDRAIGIKSPSPQSDSFHHETP